MNSVILVGNIVRTPEIQFWQETTIARFDIACNRNKDEADFIHCYCFDKAAEIIEKYTDKGSKVAVNGSLRNNNWKDKEGNMHYDFQVNVYSIELLSPKKEDEEEELPMGKGARKQRGRK